MTKKSLASPEPPPVFISRTELAKRWAVGWHTILRRERDGHFKSHQAQRAHQICATGRRANRAGGDGGQMRVNESPPETGARRVGDPGETHQLLARTKVCQSYTRDGPRAQARTPSVFDSKKIYPDLPLDLKRASRRMRRPEKNSSPMRAFGIMSHAVRNISAGSRKQKRSGKVS